MATTIHAFEVEEAGDDGHWHDNPVFVVSLAGIELHRSEHYIHSGPGGRAEAEQDALEEFAKKMRDVLNP